MWLLLIEFLVILIVEGSFPGGSVVKNPPANAGDAGNICLILGSGRSPAEENGNPLQYSCLENPMDREAWHPVVHGATELDTAEHQYLIGNSHREMCHLRSQAPCPFQGYQPGGQLMWLVFTGAPCLGEPHTTDRCDSDTEAPKFILDLGFPFLFAVWWLSQWRICLQCRRPGFDPWVKKIPWRREWQPTPVFLPGKSHGQRSLVGYSPWSRKELDMTE